MASATSLLTPAAETSALSDGQLLAAVAETGQASCFEIVVRRHTPMVYGVCRRLLGGDSDAEDAAQAVFLVLWKKAGGLAREGSVAAWLHRAARNVCRNELRARRSRLRREREASMRRPAISEAAETDELREFLDEELDRLPEKYRAVLILFHLEGRSLEEISSLLQTKAATLATHLVRARNLLAKGLTRRGMVATGVMVGPLLAAQTASAAPPAGFVASATYAAQAFAATQPAAGALAAKSAASADALLRSMGQTQFKIVAGVALLILAAATGLFFLPANQPAPAAGMTAESPTATLPAIHFDDGPYTGRIEAIASDAMVQFTAAFSPDGRRLAVGRTLSGGAGDLRIWEIPSGRLLHERFEPAGVSALTISPNGQLIACGCGDHQIRIIAADGFGAIRSLTGHVVGPTGLAFSPDSLQLASSGWDWTVRVWNVASGEQLAVGQASGQYVSSIQFDSSGQRLLSGPANKVLEHWRWDGKALSRTGEHPTPGLAATILAPNGERVVLTSGDGMGVVIADGDDGKVLREAAVPVGDGRISSLAACKDAAHIVAATERGVLLVWDGDGAAPVARWPALDGRAAMIAVDQTAAHVAAIGADGSIRVWDVASRTALCTLIEPFAPNSSGRSGAGVASAGGRFYLIERGPGQFLLYDARSGRQVARRSLPPEESRVTAVSADGTRIAFAGKSGRIQWTDASGAGSSAPRDVHTQAVTCLAMLPDGSRCVSGDESGMVCVTDPANGRVLFREPLHQGPVRCCSVLPNDSGVITAGDDGVLKILDPVKLNGAMELGRHPDAVAAIAPGPSSRLVASADVNGAISLWRIEWEGRVPVSRLERRLTAAEWRPQADAPAGTTGAVFTSRSKNSAPPAITALAISPHDRTLLIGSADAMLVQFDLAARRPSRITPTRAPVGALMFPEDETFLMVGLTDGQLYRQWASLEPERILTGHAGNVRTISYADSGRRLFSGGEDKTIRVWDPKSGEQLASAESGHGAVVALAASPDGRSLVTAGYGKGVYFWDAVSLQRTAARYDHAERVSALAFSPDGLSVASGSWDADVRLWNASTHKVLRTLKGLSRGAAAVRFSPDGALVAACSGAWTEWFRNGEVCVWEVDSGRLRYQHQGTNGGYGGLQFNPSGDRLCATSMGTVQIRDASSGRLLESRVCRGGAGESEFLNPQTLVVRGHPNTLQVLDLTTELTRSSFAADAELLFDLATSPDEQHFAAATSDGRVIIWSLSE